MREDEERDEIKEIEDNLIKLARQSLKSGDLKSVHQYIMDILRSEYKDTCVDIWSMKYYLLLASPEYLSQLEQLVQEYLTLRDEKLFGHNQTRVSYFNPKQLNNIDDLYTNWQELTGHQGESSKDLFIAFIENSINKEKENINGTLLSQ